MKHFQCGSCCILLLNGTGLKRFTTDPQSLTYLLLCFLSCFLITRFQGSGFGHGCIDPFSKKELETTLGISK